MFKADTVSTNLNDFLYRDEQSDTHENINMDIDVEPDTIENDDVTMNDVFVDTGLKIWWVNISTLQFEV